MRKLNLTRTNLLWLFFFVMALFATSCKPDQPEPPANLVPEIVSFTPSRGSENSTVIIKGKHFSDIEANNIVKFNGKQAEVIDASTTEIITKVPEDATTGRISVTVNNNTSISSTDFIVDPLAPSITSFTPATGNVNTWITITGSNFKVGAEVFFGSVKATEVTLVSKSEIRAKVPLDAATDKIKVVSNGLMALSAIDFLIPIQITGFQPTSGSIKTEVTITGSGFGSSTEVYVGTHKAAIVSSTPTQIRFLVPEGFNGHTTAEGAIKVKIGSVEVATTDKFTVTNTWIRRNNGFTDFIAGDGISFVHNNLIYYGLGIGMSGYNQQLQVYNPTTHTWGTAITIPNTINSRASLMASRLSDKIYFGTGADDNTEYKDWWEFDPATGNWTQKADYVIPIHMGTAFTIDNTIYAGIANTDKKLYAYNNGIWSAPISTNLSRRLDYASAFVINGIAYIGGGFDGFANSNKFYRFDPSTNNGLQPIEDCPAPFRGSPAFTLNGKGYVIANGDILYEYNPTAATKWTGKREAPFVSFAYAAVVNGKAYAWDIDGRMFEYNP